MAPRTTSEILRLLEEGTIIKEEAFILFARKIGGEEKGKNLHVPFPDFAEWLTHVEARPYMVANCGDIFSSLERAKFREWLEVSGESRDLG